MIQDDVFLHLGGAAQNIDLYLKMEGLNPAGSIKLKTALSMVEDAERRGVVGPGCRIVESSSGSLGIALAMVAAAKGYRFLCVTDPNTPALSVDVIRAMGSEVVQVDRPDASGGYLGSRIAFIHRLLADDAGLVWLNQYANPANWAVHDRCTAAAITAEFPDVDVLFVGTGTSGTLMGCINHFRRHSPATRIIAVDAVGSVTFGAAPEPRYIPGIGTSRRPEIFRPELVDDVVLVAEADTVRTCRWLARRYGLFAGGSTGSVVHAVLSRAPELPSGSRVVAIAPDLGERYVRTIYNDDWVADKFGPGCLKEPAEHLSELTTVRN
ncbi:2,3-diaminopropionate biosynthesis protein SbnA [Kitasatospora paracochleata]|uniref:Cysteine synthase A n=1 Tax=Kitasatospora paracochleata TaxID=58354 RepID=A0ABT1JA90_9ACTN|nr:2,3-diaminopropionate biosynthesis protein SbnA [Kitasatospora paracochleata]MCP2314370.1 cysteine synthase A [Kitasatospora paracochleata]